MEFESPLPEYFKELLEKLRKVKKLKKSFDFIIFFSTPTICAIIQRVNFTIGGKQMKHIKILNGSTLKDSLKKGGCGECQTSCQSACKTSCTVANQSCEKR